MLLDFWAALCGPCKMIPPIIVEIAEGVTDKKVNKVSVDEEPELVGTFNVMNIPTLIVIKDGKVANSVVGFRSKEVILKLLDV